MIFIDRSIPRDIADALACVRDDVEWLEPRFPDDTADEIWLAEAGRQGWVVLTRDKQIRRRYVERQAILDNNVGCFILGHKQTLNRWNLLKVIVGTLDDMEQRFAETPRPFIFTIDSTSRFSRYM